MAYPIHKTTQCHSQPPLDDDRCPIQYNQEEEEEEDEEEAYRQKTLDLERKHSNNNNNKIAPYK